jgi:hypothetical protein
VRDRQVGSLMTLQVLRGDAKQIVHVKIGQAPATTQ